MNVMRDMPNMHTIHAYRYRYINAHNSEIIPVLHLSLAKLKKKS
jgi:hypothetical protein